MEILKLLLGLLLASSVRPCWVVALIHDHRKSATTLECRRGFIRNGIKNLVLVSFVTTSEPRDALALGEGEQRMILTRKPKAPLGALIPASQQRLLLETSLGLATKLHSDMLQPEDEEILNQLKSVILDLDSATVTSYKGNKDIYVMSKFPPNQYLTGIGVRSSMNIYTANLQYGDQPDYTVTDPNWKKSFIRANDGLPDVKQVIVADLDLRDLYRNQVQLKIDDASAELHSSNCDVDELRNLLQDAANNFDKWLGMISDTDVKLALEAALEGKSIQIYDSYYAGFIPPR